ncbi:hypothetical protein GCM10011489_04480 [Gordonia jinhuaensis]|uniref:Low molecular weight antigen MTB12-like C-terminal domain-containing protein n=1 Tax=Gordonia jinhuaensis TaxID=1517702 RepID=A0A916SVT4_9ACTN|nr:hypothetical protein GCM10011489_04480 [Gordonia jinhuaensis]
MRSTDNHRPRLPRGPKEEDGFVKVAKLAVAGMAVAAFLSVAACGSDDNSDSSSDTTTTSATTSAAATGTAAAGDEAGVTDSSTPPTAATLDAMLQKAIDPNVPATDKTQLVEGSEADPQLFDKLVQAKQDNPGVTYKIIPPVVSSGANQATAKVRVQLPNNPVQNVDASIVFTDGRWKLSKNTICPLLQANNINSAMCPASS